MRLFLASDPTVTRALERDRDCNFLRSSLDMLGLILSQYNLLANSWACLSLGAFSNAAFSLTFNERTSGAYTSAATLEYLGFVIALTFLTDVLLIACIFLIYPEYRSSTAVLDEYLSGSNLVSINDYRLDV